MSEVVHMNPDDENAGKVKFDFLLDFPNKRLYVARQKAYEQAAALSLDTVISINEITAEESERRRVYGSRFIHVGVRDRIKKQLDEILKPTHGRIVYAEQVVCVLNTVGQFPLAQCEVVRKAIAKKKPEKVSAYRELFRAAVMGGLQDNEIDDLWAKIEKAGEYNFCRSHLYAEHRLYHLDKFTPECPFCQEYSCTSFPPNSKS